MSISSFESAKTLCSHWRYAVVALTENQGKLLRKYTEEVILSYDADEAGQNAIMRGIDVLQNLGMTCKVLQMSGAKDPDEYVLKYGPERFNQLIDSSITAVEYKILNLKKMVHTGDHFSRMFTL